MLARFRLPSSAEAVATVASRAERRDRLRAIMAKLDEEDIQALIQKDEQKQPVQHMLHTVPPILRAHAGRQKRSAASSAAQCSVAAHQVAERCSLLTGAATALRR